MVGGGGGGGDTLISVTTISISSTSIIIIINYLFQAPRSGRAKAGEQSLAILYVPEFIPFRLNEGACVGVFQNTRRLIVVLSHIFFPLKNS